ncbi:RagB/SusD family nutrient uptake outer membrane protein [Draconibacterium halophilum]|uniref:RagB/SusD family nutrient uptake outer membrane protein n=1 Tax=Draconibacterium halophilum TaxID=2706887 RepID=A0A6C0RG88_9BACT|nr:RagB/SusD family nutrient uptake outer membrane protein [Draconibacterium halophilum]QIA09149.1 RagB/SusD family nutrient uptake outer membrane protein [Draconibacterium halophilum]
MKKVFIYIIALLFFSGCSDILDTEPKTTKVVENFYQTTEDAEQALAAAYSSLYGTFDAYWMGGAFFASELRCDDRLAGSAIGDVEITKQANFETQGSDTWRPIWSGNYKGIYRCNILLENLDYINWENDEQRDKYEGETKFLRAYFYFELAKFFENIPLLLETSPVNPPQAAPEETYAQIASDLKQAIELLPAIPFSSSNTDNIGHVTRWAAEALMARVFLFYTGLYNQETLPLPDNGNITKNEVIVWIDECANSSVSGHALIPDFRNLWPYAYGSGKGYKYATDNNLQWIGVDGENNETIFAIKYSTLANWWQYGGGVSETWSNGAMTMSGWRLKSPYTSLPFGQGFGYGPVNPNLYDEWEETDIRKKGSILRIDDPAEGIIGYSTEATDQQKDETGFWSKKYMPVNVSANNGAVLHMTESIYGEHKGQYLENVQDMVIIRYADVLLMGAELGSSHAQEYLDAIRHRAGLPSIPVTLENIKMERRHELAFEGLRLFDLMRWGDLESAVAQVKDIPVKNNGVPATVSKTYRSETRGFLQIPWSQISLSNGVLNQNSGWEK